MNLFAYGTLMDEEIMARAGNCRPDSLPAILADHERFSLLGRDYPAIVSKGGATATGVCYLHLSDSAWKALDIFEGKMYERISVKVTTIDGQSLAAETYLCRPEFRHLLEERDWSFEDFLKSYKTKFEKEYCGFEKVG